MDFTSHSSPKTIWITRNVIYFLVGVIIIHLFQLIYLNIIHQYFYDTHTVLGLSSLHSTISTTIISTLFVIICSLTAKIFDSYPKNKQSTFLLTLIHWIVLYLCVLGDNLLIGFKLFWRSFLTSPSHLPQYTHLFG